MRSIVLCSAIILAGVLALPTLASAQDSPSASMSSQRDDNDQWGWIGLLGLAGLLGLRRREHVDHRVTPRTAP